MLVSAPTHPPTHRPPTALAPAPQDVKTVHWHPSGEVLVSASYDDSIKLWVEEDDEWICAQTLAGGRFCATQGARARLQPCRLPARALCPPCRAALRPRGGMRRQSRKVGSANAPANAHDVHSNLFSHPAHGALLCPPLEQSRRGTRRRCGRWPSTLPAPAWRHAATTPR